MSTILMGEMVENGTKVAKSINDLGMSIVASAFFLVLAAAMMIACFRWFKTLIDNMFTKQAETQKQIVDALTRNSELLADIADEVKPTQLARIKSISKTNFDLDFFEMCEAVHEVKEQNHISDRPATERKVRRLVRNMLTETASNLDFFHYKGRSLSEYIKYDEWENEIATAVLKEVYAETFKEERLKGNMEVIFKEIKNDFYKQLV